MAPELWRRMCRTLTRNPPWAAAFFWGVGTGRNSWGGECFNMFQNISKHFKTRCFSISPWQLHIAACYGHPLPARNGQITWSWEMTLFLGGPDVSFNSGVNKTCRKKQSWMYDCGVCWELLWDTLGVLVSVLDKIISVTICNYDMGGGWRWCQTCWKLFNIL